MADPFDDEHVEMAANILKAAQDALGPEAYPQTPTDTADRKSGHPGYRGMLIPQQIPQGGYTTEPWTPARVWERAAVPDILYGPFKGFNDILAHLKAGGDINDPSVVDKAAEVAGGILGGTAFKQMSSEAYRMFKPGKIAQEAIERVAPGEEQRFMAGQLQAQGIADDIVASRPKINKEVPEAVGKVDPPRVDELGFYSHAEDLAKAWPQEKGTKEQALKYLKTNQTKNAELKDMGLDEALKGEGTITKQELVELVQKGRGAPKETQYGGVAQPQLAGELLMAAEDLAANGKLADKAFAEIREIVGYLRTHEVKWGELKKTDFTPDAWKVIENFQEVAKKHSGVGKDGPPIYSDYALDLGMNPTYRESVINLPGPKQYSDRHWTGIDNPILHTRTSQQQTSSGKRVLQLEEIQSDWGQKGRDLGFRDAKTLETLTERRRIAQDKVIDLQKHYDAQGDNYDFTNVDSILSLFVGTFGPDRRWLELSLKNELKNQHYLTEASSPIQKLQMKRAVHRAIEKVKSGERLPKEDLFEAQTKLDNIGAELYKEDRKLPHHPAIETTDRWTAIGLRRLLRQAVEADVDAVSIPTGKLIDSLGMGGKQAGHDKFYNEMLPKNLKQILSKFDKDITAYEDTLVGHEGKGSVIVFDLTPKARQKIGEGQRFYVGGVPLPAGKDEDNAPRSP